MTLGIHKLKIDGHPWRIRYRPNPKIDGVVVNGIYDEDKHQITINSNLTLLYQLETLLHEIHHISGDEVYGFEEHDDTEKFRLYTRRFFAIMHDNSLLWISINKP